MSRLQMKLKILQSTRHQSTFSKEKGPETTWLTGKLDIHILALNLKS